MQKSRLRPQMEHDSQDRRCVVPHPFRNLWHFHRARPSEPLGRDAIWRRGGAPGRAAADPWCSARRWSCSGVASPFLQAERARLRAARRLECQAGSARGGLAGAVARGGDRRPSGGRPVRFVGRGGRGRVNSAASPGGVGSRGNGGGHIATTTPLRLLCEGRTWIAVFRCRAVSPGDVANAWHARPPGRG